MNDSLTQILAARAAQLRYEDLPADVIRVCKQCVLDWLGVTLAAHRESLVDKLVAVAIEEGAGDQAMLIGRGGKYARSQAALINGAAGHALDYDDSSVAMGGHASATILPALLAQAEGRRYSGREFITAYVSGYEAACAVGAAVACSRLMGLDVAGTTKALGIAATSVSGLRANFGTMCKPLHAGLAARSGLTAAVLSASGFSANERVLEAECGFGPTYSPQTSKEKALATPTGGFFLPDNLFKYHAACHGTHGAMAIRAGTKPTLAGCTP